MHKKDKKMYQGLKTRRSQALALFITSLCPCLSSRVRVVVNIIAVGAVSAGGMGVFRGWLFVIVVVEVTVNNILAKNKENRQKKTHLMLETYASRALIRPPLLLLLLPLSNCGGRRFVCVFDVEVVVVKFMLG